MPLHWEDGRSTSECAVQAAWGIKLTAGQPNRARCGDKGENAVATAPIHDYRRSLHPVHAVLLASMLPLFLGALLSDWAYASTKEVQWINFAAWLVVGGLVFAGAALLWAVIEALRADAPRGNRKWIYVGLLAATFVVGFIDALVHSKDAGATMPAGLILSVILFLLALAANWAGFSAPRAGEAK